MSDGRNIVSPIYLLAILYITRDKIYSRVCTTFPYCKWWKARQEATYIVECRLHMILLDTLYVHSTIYIKDRLTCSRTIRSNKCHSDISSQGTSCSGTHHHMSSIFGHKVWWALNTNLHSCVWKENAHRLHFCRGNFSEFVYCKNKVGTVHSLPFNTMCIFVEISYYHHPEWWQ